MFLKHYNGHKAKAPVQTNINLCKHCVQTYMCLLCPAITRARVPSLHLSGHTSDMQSGGSECSDVYIDEIRAGPSPPTGLGDEISQPPHRALLSRTE
jgi:hypothetical protein